MSPSRFPRIRLVALFTGVLALALALVACSKPASTSSGTIKIGLIWPFNGFASNYGPDGLAGARLALKEAHLSAGGRKVELVQANENVLDPSSTLTEVKRLVQQDGVNILLGPVFGSSQQAIAPYLKAHNVMSFVPYGATKELGGTGNTISWPSLDTAFSAPLGGYLKNTLHLSRIATLAPDYVYGHNLLEGAVNSFKAAGGAVTQQQWVPLGTTDLLPYATNLTGNADALVMWLVPQDAATFIKDYRALNRKLPLILVNGLFDPTFQQIGSQIIGTYGLVDWSAALDNAANKDFVAAFKAANGGATPDNNNAAAYTDTKIALAAITAAKGNTSFDSLKKAVEAVHLDTPYGTGSIDSQFYGVTSRTVVKVTQSSDGRYVWSPVTTFPNVPNNQS